MLTFTTEYLHGPMARYEEYVSTSMHKDEGRGIYKDEGRGIDKAMIEMFIIKVILINNTN